MQAGVLVSIGAAAGIVGARALTLVAAVACAAPARRAMTVDPLTVLRYE